MSTVKIYKITCTKAYAANEQGNGYSLSPWGYNTEYYEGYDDGGKMYTLPEGFTTAQSNGGTNEIYDNDGERCTIVMHSSGMPQLVSTSKLMPVLEIAE